LFIKCYSSRNQARHTAVGIVQGLNNKNKTTLKRAYGFKSFFYLALSSTWLLAGLSSPNPHKDEESIINFAEL
jgi:hypothetical protein